jgi:hypothetical protein
MTKSPSGGKGAIISARRIVYFVADRRKCDPGPKTMGPPEASRLNRHAGQQPQKVRQTVAIRLV